MKSIEECVVDAMDGSDKELLPYLPYILQDIWEIGADPNAIIKLIRKHCNDFSQLKVLDLGCGKGAVAIKISKEFGCFCYGIDAISDFIEFAKKKANEFMVGQLCNFEIGDIRDKVKYLSGYDIIILGAIGPVFGDYFSTLSTLEKCLNEKGIFIIDDGYINDESDFIHPLISRKSELLLHIKKAGMVLLENDTMSKTFIKESNDFIFERLKNRCYELIEKFPDRQDLFLDYIRKQEIENIFLENKVVGTTLVIRRKI